MSGGNQHRTPFVDGGLAVVKGAACVIFLVPTGESTCNVKFLANNEGCVTLCGLTTEDFPDCRDELQRLIDSKIADECPFEVFRCDRKHAEKKFGRAMYDKFAVPTTQTELRIQTLREHSINANSCDVVRHTGLLGSVRVKEVKFAAGTVEIRFSVHPRPEVLNMPKSDLVAIEKKIARFEDMPGLLQFLPRSGCEPPIPGIDDCEQEVTPWSVQSGEKGVDYNKLIEKFGCSYVTDDLITKIEKVTGKSAPYLLKRKLFFSHRDFDILVDQVAKGRDFYLYTGRGPSSDSLHIGHLIPFMFTAELQRLFNVPVVIELTDDEKFLFKENLTLRETYRLAYDNAKDIIACGFDPEKTFIFTDLDYIHGMYPLGLAIQKKVTFSQVRGIFGFNESNNIGEIAFPAIQAAPSFSHCFPGFFKDPEQALCLIPQAIDQDPYFRMTRDVAPRLKLKKPALVHSKFLPALQGFHTKMSGSVENTCVFVTDAPEKIREKITKYAFTGGRETLSEHREKGANLGVDVPFQYLCFLLKDDKKLEQIRQDYSSGKMLSGEVKEILINVLIDITQDHQKKRAKVSDADVLKFMNLEKMQKYEKIGILNRKAHVH